MLYIDDMFIANSNLGTLNALKYQLKSAFAMKNLGSAEYILDMSANRDKQQLLIHVSQEMYTEKAFEKVQHE